MVSMASSVKFSPVECASHPLGSGVDTSGDNFQEGQQCPLSVMSWCPYVSLILSLSGGHLLALPLLESGWGTVGAIVVVVVRDLGAVATVC